MGWKSRKEHAGLCSTLPCLPQALMNIMGAFAFLSILLVGLRCVIQYSGNGSTFVLSDLAKTFVTFTHYLFRKAERTGNLRPVLVYATLAFEYW